jgi:hypothetical protein
MMRFKEERWVGVFGELLAARRTNRKMQNNLELR